MIPMLSVEEARRRGKEVGVSEQFAGLNVFRAMLHNPTAAAALANLLSTLLMRGKLEPRVRELVVLRSGWRSASEYEFCQHVQVAKRLGMSEQEILGVRDPAACPAYSDLDRAVIRMTDELLDTANVSPETWSVIEKSFTPEHQVELILAAGNWRMIAMFLNAGGVALDQGVPSWPEGKRPRVGAER